LFPGSIPRCKYLSCHLPQKSDLHYTKITFLWTSTLQSHPSWASYMGHRYKITSNLLNPLTSILLIHKVVASPWEWNQFGHRVPIKLLCILMYTTDEQNSENHCVTTYRF
jgi:hypothetical protein